MTDYYSEEPTSEEQILGPDSEALTQMESAPPPEMPPIERAQRVRRPVDRINALIYGLLAVVLSVGAWLRFDAQNWDDFTHLHPDERFLTGVVDGMNGPLRITGREADVFDSWGNIVELGKQHIRCNQRYPAKPTNADDPLVSTQLEGQGGYFDAECSALNPNNTGNGSYVYGEFPLFTVHLGGVARTRLSEDYHTFLQTFDPDKAATHKITTYWETYTGIQFIGRSMNALADTLTILVVFLIGRRLYGRWPGIMAAALYAFAAFPIQQTHFWTVDAFTTFWVALALYFAVRVIDNASAIGGPQVLLYLAIWAGGVAWDAAYWERPALGAASLGIIFLVMLGITAAIRQGMLWGGLPKRHGDVLVALAGVIASVVYLLGWTLLDVTAPRNFPLAGELQKLGLASLTFALAAFIAYLVAGMVRRAALGERITLPVYMVLGVVIVLWAALVVGVLIDGLAPWAALFVALTTVAFMLFDAVEVTDYALFGVAVGAAVASRINVAPLAGIIVIAAGIRLLPALDRKLLPQQRGRMVGYVMTGLLVSGLMAFIAFRLLQPHAFMGPNIWNIKFNPNWRDDMNEAAYFTSGDWDAPPNHQWANRIPYFFPWRNIVLWGLGLPLGLIAWAAWAWAGITIVRGRKNWTRHLIPFVWVLVCFGWLGGRWVTTMRYFMPIYPMLAVFGAWALWAMVVTSWRSLKEIQGRFTNLPLQHDARWRRIRRIAFAGAVGLLIFVYGYTTLFGFGMHNIQRRQLTRVAASRWFQENVPGDFGLWVEGKDGTRQLINVARGTNAAIPAVTRLEQGDAAVFACQQDGTGNCLLDENGAVMPFTMAADARLTRIIFPRLNDPAGDAELETLQVRLYQTNTTAGRVLVYDDAVRADLSLHEAPYGTEFSLTPPDEEVVLARENNGAVIQYSLELTVLEGGPISFVHDVSDQEGSALSDVSIGLQRLDDRTLTFIDLKFETEPLLTGHGDDVPSQPTHWAANTADPSQFSIPIDGEIRELVIPHLGDPMKDDDAETVKFTLVSPDGQTVSATVTDDFNAGANPLGPARTVIFDPPLQVTKTDLSSPIFGTLIVEPEDPIYTSGPIIAWEGDWDDPVPWPTCELPADMVYADDLPSGLSQYTCGAVNPYDGRSYQGLKLWMVAEDNEEKYSAMTNALNQADYIVVTSNRFYDSLPRVEMRWPMTEAYYDALFDGRLGFELVRKFESVISVGPFRVPDQVIPSDDVPDWMNEHWESEEAFSVYDHPLVLVFRKTEAYSPENTAAILNSVSRKSITTVGTGDLASNAQPVGVVAWGAKTATTAPTMLEMPEDKWEIQTDGGTWSDLFDLDSILNRSQVLAVIVWWLVTMLVGWITWPLLFAIFPALPDRGFPAAKITGWLLVAFTAWVGGTVNILTWTRPGIFILIVLLALLSGAVIWRRRAEFRLYIRANKRHLIAVEALTLLLFLFFIGIRLGNPDLWHTSFGGEKPMDFAYFNGVIRSTVFPPIDPWHAGGYMNYYYFGYVIVGAPVKLLGIQPSVAYNLILPMLYAMTGIGVFSIGYNWVRARRVSPGQIIGATRDGIEEPAKGAEAVGAIHKLPLQRETKLPAGSAWLAGLLATLLAVVLGNLAVLNIIGTDLATMGGYESKPALHQLRRYELEQQRPKIYADITEQEMEKFRKKHDGRDPQTAEESMELARMVQEKTDSYILKTARHAPLWKIWEYHLDGLRKQIAAIPDGMKKVMDGASIPVAGTHRWYWAPTRILGDVRPLMWRDVQTLSPNEPNNPVYGQPGNSAIAEMPYFTFLYGDLHAHMIAMPITLLVLLWLLAEIIGAGYALRAWWEAGLALALGSIAVGVLRPTNSWDWITYLILGAAGLTYVAWVGAVRQAQDKSETAVKLERWLRVDQFLRLWPVLFVIPVALVARVAFYVVRQSQADAQKTRPLQAGEELIRPTLTLPSVVLWVVAALALTALAYIVLIAVLRARVNKHTLVDWIGRLALFGGFSTLAAMPFTHYFATVYTKVKPWELDTSPMYPYLYIHGTFLFLVVSLLIWQTARWLRSVRVRAMQGMLIPVLAILFAISVIVLGGIVWGVRDVSIAQIAVPLMGWAGLLFFVPKQHPLQRALYALVVLAMGITLGVELVVLDGDIGRQNTVFKFYLQVWFMLSVVGGVTLAWLLRASARWNVFLRGFWQSGVTLLLSIALLYPVLGTQARFLDRFNKAETPLTLDGMEYMKHAIHSEMGVWFRLESDYNLIRWLQENVEGTPVIMEAHMYGMSEYHWGGRISIYTGLPTILGWRWHQVQQHTLPNMDQLIAAREIQTKAFYSLPEVSGAEEQAIQTAWDIIQEYGIEYIVVGPLERIFYGDIGLDPATNRPVKRYSEGITKFDRMVELGLLQVVYDAMNCIDVYVPIEECPAEAVYSDKIYRVVDGVDFDGAFATLVQ